MEKYNWSLEKIYKNVDEARAEIKLCDEFVEKLAKEEKFPKGMYKQRSKFLCFVGKNSLWVYILHQPAIYLVMLIIAFIIA